ncbi:MAG: phosphatase PAP2 family protein [bacterium]|nr:phosphatase PAP2 family protein [bacterium]
MNTNTFLFFKINGLAENNFYLDTLGIFFAYYFEYIFIFILLIILFYKYKKEIFIYWRAFLSAIISRFVFTEIIRYFFYRPRPFDSSQINLLIPGPDSASFPSGHAAFYSAIAFYILLKDKKIGGFALICALLISASRIFVGVHWPIDIVAGFVVGLISAILVDKFLPTKKTQN